MAYMIDDYSSTIKAKELNSDALIRKFYIQYGLFQGLSEMNLNNAFIQFLEVAYDVFDALGSVYRFEFQEILDKVWENEYELKDDIDVIETVEEIEQLFRNRTIRVVKC